MLSIHEKGGFQASKTSKLPAGQWLIITPLWVETISKNGRSNSQAWLLAQSNDISRLRDSNFKPECPLTAREVRPFKTKNDMPFVDHMLKPIICWDMLGFEWIHHPKYHQKWMQLKPSKILAQAGHQQGQTGQLMVSRQAMQRHTHQDHPRFPDRRHVSF